MLPEVRPTSITEVNYQELFGFAQRVLGRSITRQLDARDMASQTQASFIAALDCIRNESSDPMKAVRDGGGLLEHLHYGFMVHCTTAALLEILQATGLRAVTDKVDDETSFSVISGNLAIWYSSILHCCRKEKSFECRAVFNKCLIHFERGGLGEVWGHFGKDILTLFDSKTPIEFISKT